MSCLAFNSTNTILASSSLDGVCALFNPQTCELIRTINSDGGIPDSRSGISRDPGISGSRSGISRDPGISGSRSGMYVSVLARGLQHADERVHEGVKSLIRSMTERGDMAAAVKLCEVLSSSDPRVRGDTLQVLQGLLGVRRRYVDGHVGKRPVHDEREDGCLDPTQIHGVVVHDSLRHSPDVQGAHASMEAEQEGGDAGWARGVEGTEAAVAVLARLLMHPDDGVQVHVCAHFLCV